MLLEIGDWRKFGGRLRLNEDDRLELHVPREFTPERPAVKYTHEAFGMSIHSHPLGKRMPKVTEKPSIQHGAQEFKEFAVTKGDPVNGSDLFKGDKPQMSLRIVSFSDATLVSLVWPHSAMDPVGFQAMLKNWSLVMAGRESEVLPVLGAKDDMVYDIVEPPGWTEETEQEESHLAQKRISDFKLVLFGLRFLWDLLWQGACQSKSIFLPKEAVAKLMRQTLEEITITTPLDDEGPFISEGDVLAAWTTRLIASSDPRQLLMTTLTTVNLRYRIKSLMQTTGVYTQNLATAAYTFLSPAMARGPTWSNSPCKPSTSRG
ncbi:hypothetical protein BHE90_010579 [Fusarium euwallaceae]|uniref:Uncharacterized protein n=1 Tax=Fusarium euwallaceae TaxID=1147111 RepID=A0A430LGU9_9HYPO|nr:hypothetical protein BHE90_010579 [Fusarium euwallaceae]